MGQGSGEQGRVGLASGTELVWEAGRSQSGPPGGKATPGGGAHCLAAVVATEQGQEAGMLESVGVQPVRLTPSVALAALEALGQGWAGLRAQGLEGVGQEQDPGESVGCSRPPLSGLLAWALAAASC